MVLSAEQHEASKTFFRDGAFVKCINKMAFDCTVGIEYKAVMQSSSTIMVIDDVGKRHSFMLELNLFSDVYYK